MRTRTNLLGLAALSGLLVTASLAGAQPGPVSEAITYQGVLENNGQPVQGMYDVAGWVYNQATGGSVVGTGVVVTVPVSRGRFTAEFNFDNPSMYNGTERWLEVRVRPAGSGGYTTLSPRQRLGPAPFCNLALDIPSQWKAFSFLPGVGPVYNGTGSVGIGTDAPDHRLHVESTARRTAMFEGSNTVGTWLGIHNTTTTSTRPFWKIIAGGSGNGTVDGALLFDASSSPDVVQSVNLTLQPNGRVGVGTTSPLAALHVQSTGDYQGRHVALFENTSASDGDGVAIRINQAHTNRQNNFVTFYNGTGMVTGRIEGFDLQNNDWVSPPPLLGDLALDPNISVNPTGNWFSAGSLPSLSFSTVNVLGIPVVDGINFNPGSLPFINPSAVLNFGTPMVVGTPPSLESVQELMCWTLDTGIDSFFTSDPVALAMESLKVAAAQLCLDEGVTYGSKGADYAEWLERLHEGEDIRMGQIVGVLGGRITKDTSAADHFMVVSHAPVVLGNQPPADRVHAFERVAFMGQVPTLVRGRVHVGDYILPSGLNDGSGVAVPPGELRPEHLGRVVGRAWSDSENDLIGFINVLVGVGTNELAAAVASHHRRAEQDAATIRQLQAQCAANSARLDALSSQVEELMRSRKAGAR